MSIQTGPEYILHCRSLGFNDGEITEAMAKVGWQPADVQAAFTSAAQYTAQAGVPGTGKKKGSRLWLWIIIGVVSFVLVASTGAAIFFVMRS